MQTIVIKATLERAPVESGVIIKSESLVASVVVQPALGVPVPAQAEAAKKEEAASAAVAAAFAQVTVKLGLDVHAAQITACRQLDGSLPQAAHRRSLAELLKLVEEHRARGESL